MIKIRLNRQGSKKRAFYRIVAVDQRKKRNSALEIIGTWDPLKNIKNIDKKKLEDFLSRGAQKTKSVEKLLSE